MKKKAVGEIQCHDIWSGHVFVPRHFDHFVPGPSMGATVSFRPDAFALCKSEKKSYRLKFFVEDPTCQF
jgi:hypothetical protein